MTPKEASIFRVLKPDQLPHLHRVKLQLASHIVLALTHLLDQTKKYVQRLDALQSLSAEALPLTWSSAVISRHDRRPRRLEICVINICSCPKIIPKEPRRDMTQTWNKATLSGHLDKTLVVCLTPGDNFEKTRRNFIAAGRLECCTVLQRIKCRLTTPKLVC